MLSGPHGSCPGRRAVRPHPTRKSAISKLAAPSTSECRQVTLPRRQNQRITWVRILQFVENGTACGQGGSGTGVHHSCPRRPPHDQESTGPGIWLTKSSRAGNCRDSIVETTRDLPVARQRIQLHRGHLHRGPPGLLGGTDPGRGRRLLGHLRPPELLSGGFELQRLWNRVGLHHRPRWQAPLLVARVFQPGMRCPIFLLDG